MIRICPPQGLIALQIFDVPLDDVVTVVRYEVLADWPNVTHRQLSEQSVALQEAEYNPKDRFVHIWEPRGRPGSAVLRASLEDGWPTLTYAAVRRHLWTLVKIRVSGDRDIWPIRELELVVKGEERRFVRSMKDDPRWQFYEKGAPLPFEDDAAYRRRRIRDRFTPEMLWSYVGALGWDSSSEQMWTATRCSVIHVPSKAG